MEVNELYFRYVDIFLGNLLLVSHLSLLNGSHKKSNIGLFIFFLLSFTSLLLYWSWFAYLKYAIQDSEANKEVENNFYTMFNI